MVINKDDSSFSSLKRSSKNEFIGYSSNKASELQAKNISKKKDRLYFDLIDERNTFKVETSFPGGYNVPNILAGIATAKLSNIPRAKGSEVIELIGSFVDYMKN